MKEFFNKNWKYLAILAGFLAVASIYFLPALQGYFLVQGDTSSWKSAAKELMDFRAFYGKEAVWTNSMFGGMPGYIINTIYLNGFTQIDKLIGLGLPFPIDVMFISMVSFLILSKSLKVETLIAIIGAVAFAFISYNLLIIEAGHNTKMRAIAYMPAVLGAFIMMYKSKKLLFPTALLSFFMALEIRAGHIQMTYYLAFILIAIGIYEFINYIKSNQIKSFLIRTILIVFASSFGLLANFTNTYYTYSYGKDTMRGTPEITVKPDGNSKEKTQSSGLDRDYIVQWCYGKQETLNLLIPNAKGDSKNLTGKYFDYLRESNPQLYNFSVEQYQKNGGKVFGGYWGDQPFTSGANYLGAVIVLLAIMYLIFVKSKLKWAFAGVSFLALLLAWGKNLGGSVDEMWLTNFFIDYVPLYSKFRAVSSILVILNLLFPLMAVLFINYIYKNKEWAKQNLKKLMIVAGSIGGIVLILALMPNLLSFTSDTENVLLNGLYNQQNGAINIADLELTLTEFRSGEFQKDAFRTLGFMTIAIALLFLWISDKLKYNLAILGLAFLALIDVTLVDKRYLNNEKNPQNKREYLSWEKVTGFENTPNASQGDYQIYSIQTEKNPKIEQEALERISEAKKVSKKNSSKIEESIRFATLNFNTNYRVMNLDNPFNSATVAYFHKSSGGYHAAKMARYQDMIDFYIQGELSMLQTPEKTKVLNMLNTKYYLYQGNLVLDNQYAYGNAWFVNNTKVVENANQEILAIGDINPKETAVVNKKFENLIDKSYQNNEAFIVMEDYKPNHIIYNSKSNSNQLAVFSEMYYHDDWVAYIDGKQVPHLRANYVLRSLPVPAGEHKIEFKFEPKMIVVGDIISISVFVLIILALAFSFFQEWKAKNEDKLTRV
jgi:Bacterial membrane protein YfhO